MCVIMVVRDDKLRPTEVMIEKAAEYNDDGIGVAYREGDKENRVVVWHKGLENTDLDEVKKMAKDLPVPYVMHFRAASIGDVCKQLTHPFPIDVKVPLALTGKTKGRVLFQNGTWDDWRKWLLEAIVKSNVKLPAGKWSDTRAMAMLSGIYGDWFMELLSDTQKAVVFGPYDYELFLGKDGWAKVSDIWCSNNHFMTKTRSTTIGYASANWDRVCRYGPCQRHDVDTYGHCPLHTGGKLVMDAVTVGTGGSPSVVSTPFLPGTIIPLGLADQLHHVKEFGTGKRAISRNLMKEIKKQHQRMESKDQRESSKGRKALERLTAKLVQENQRVRSLLTSQPLSGPVN